MGPARTTASHYRQFSNYLPMSILRKSPCRDTSFISHVTIALSNVGVKGHSAAFQ